MCGKGQIPAPVWAPRPLTPAARTEFELPDKYEFVRALGKGAYGFVCLFKIGAQGDKEVAVKKVGPFRGGMRKRSGAWCHPSGRGPRAFGRRAAAL